MFKGKKFVVFGVANDRSIAWAIAQALSQQGAEVALTYANEVIEKRVRPLADSIGCKVVAPCDVQSDEQLDSLFAHLQDRWGVLDGAVHSIAYAAKEDLQQNFAQTTRDGFRTALEISAYSMIAITGRASQLMGPNGGSILTLTYLGAQRVIPNYNIMGVAKAALEASVKYLAADLGSRNVRVNALSAGPLKTLAASGIPQFKDLLAEFARRAPMGRNVTLEDVAGPALFLLGPWASAVTGEVLYVDCGYNVMGL